APDLAGGEQLVLCRRPPLGLLHHARHLAAQILAARHRSDDAPRAGDRPGAGGGLLRPRPSAGRRAGQGAALKSRLSRSVPRWLAVLALVLAATPAGAHVGSPNVFFDGSAGPYPVRVIVRMPVVIPGLAE